MEESVNCRLIGSKTAYRITFYAFSVTLQFVAMAGIEPTTLQDSLNGVEPNQYAHHC